MAIVANRLITHEFDRDLSVVEQVVALKNDTKAALANLLADTIVYTDDV